MKKTLLIATAASLVSISTAAPAQVIEPRTQAILQGANELRGTFTDNLGGTYTVSVLADVVDYRNGNSHKVFVIPESHKFVVTPAEGAPRVTCPFQFAGIDAYGGNQLPVTCNWVRGNGSSAPRGTFTMGVGAATAAARSGEGASPVEPRTPTVQISQRTLDGEFEFNNVTYTVSYDADVLDYRNGNSHKVDIVPESHKKTVTPAFSGPGFKVQCPPFEGPGVKAKRSQNPVTCTWTAGNRSDAPTGQFAIN